MKLVASLLGIGLLLGSCGDSGQARAESGTDEDFEPVIGRRFVSPLVPLRAELDEDWELPLHAIALEGGRLVLQHDLDHPAEAFEVSITWGPGDSRPVNPDFLESDRYPFSLERYLEAQGDRERRSDPYREFRGEGATTILGSPAHFFEVAWKKMPVRSWKLFVNSPAGLIHFEVSVPEASELSLERVSEALDAALHWDTNGIWWTLAGADESHRYLVQELVEEGDSGPRVSEDVRRRILNLGEDTASLLAWGISSTHDRLKRQHEAEVRMGRDPVEAAMHLSSTEVRLSALAELAADSGDLRLMVPLIHVAQEEGSIGFLGRFRASAQPPLLAQPFR